jgi:hypothetical protein
VPGHSLRHCDDSSNLLVAIHKKMILRLLTMKIV